MSVNVNDKQTRNFVVEGVDQRLLFGQNDVFLRLIETHFPVKIVARGEKISVEGNQRDVDRVFRLLNDFVTRLKQGDYLSEQYVYYAISMVQENGYGLFLIDALLDGVTYSSGKEGKNSILLLKNKKRA